MRIFAAWIRILGAAVSGVLLMCNIASADIVKGTSGANWQSWTVATLNQDNNPYWDGNSADSGAAYSVGNCLVGTNCTAIPAAERPGAIPYWGMVSGAADPSFYLNRSVPTSNAALKIEIAGNKGINAFGWYDITDPSTLVEIFKGSDSPDASKVFTPTLNYGFWFRGSQGTYYTQSSLNQPSANQQQFAIFQASAVPGREVYWLGMEDLNLGGSDKDYNDMVVKISGVPDGGVTLVLLGGAMVGLEALRRRLRS